MTAPTAMPPWLPAAAGGLIAVGALFMMVKGVARAATGTDPSLVPFFGAFVCAGLAAAAGALWKSAARVRWLAAVAGTFAAAGGAASLMAIAYLATGTIPETAGAPPLAGGAYLVLSVGAFGSLAALGGGVAVNRSLPGWWRWLPLGLTAAQIPIFAIAEVTGALTGSDVVADWIGPAVTGAAWMLLGFGVTRGQTRSPRGRRRRHAWAGRRRP